MMDLIQRKKRFRISLLSAVVASLAVHFLLASGIYVFEPLPVKSERIEVQLIEKEKPAPPTKKPVALPKNNAKQVVDQDQNPINHDIDQDAKYLSAHDQKVVKQTRATHNGDFQNTASRSAVAGNGGQPSKINLQDFSPKFDISKAVRDRQEREKIFDHDPDAIKVEAAKNNQQKPPPAAIQPGEGGDKVSQTLDYIKDLDPGLETLLSTREFIYYTYYARMRRQLNQFWGPKVKEKITSIYRQGRQIASSEDKITRCLVILDRSGNLSKVQIIGNSGIRELDEAAVEAFKSAAPFPNPPTGIVEPDGTIKIRWDFILEV